MQKRNTFIFLFLTLFSFSAALFFLFNAQPTIPGGNIISSIFSPAREAIIRTAAGRRSESGILGENARLQRELRAQKKQDADLRALRDQFETEKIRSNTLLPANILGMKGLIPGVSLPNGMIIDKGSDHGVRAGHVVIYKDNVIGRIGRVTQSNALIQLVYAEGLTLNAKTLRTNALGLIAGQGQGVMQMSGVVLSEKLEVNDQVLTKGDKDLDGTGFPPDLVIGKIVTVDKKASNLFQSAQVESLIDMTKLTMVFVVTN